LTAGCGGSQKFCFEILIHFNEEGSYLNHVWKKLLSLKRV
jgi:hypothetical protein